MIQLRTPPSALQHLREPSTIFCLSYLDSVWSLGVWMCLRSLDTTHNLAQCPKNCCFSQTTMPGCGVFWKGVDMASKKCDDTNHRQKRNKGAYWLVPPSTCWTQPPTNRSCRFTPTVSKRVSPRTGRHRHLARRPSYPKRRMVQHGRRGRARNKDATRSKGHRYYVGARKLLGLLALLPGTRTLLGASIP